jgi:hypothetical protein
MYALRRAGLEMLLEVSASIHVAASFGTLGLDVDRRLFFQRVQRRRVTGPFARRYDSIASATWRVQSN